MLPLGLALGEALGSSGMSRHGASLVSTTASAQAQTSISRPRPVRNQAQTKVYPGQGQGVSKVLIFRLWVNMHR